MSAALAMHIWPWVVVLIAALAVGVYELGRYVWHWHRRRARERVRDAGLPTCKACIRVLANGAKGRR